MCELLSKENFKQFKSPFKPSDACYIEFDVTLNRLSWRLQAITELEDAGLSGTERCSCLRAEVSGLFNWANAMLATWWSTKE